MSADMDVANLRIRLFDAVGGDPDLAQAIWEIVSPELAERDALKAELAEAKEAYLAVIEAAELRGTVRHLERELAEARAAIVRVRALCDRKQRQAATGHAFMFGGVPFPADVRVDDVLAALDAPQRPEDTREETGS